MGTDRDEDALSNVSGHLIPGQEEECMKNGDIIYSLIGMGLSLWLILESQKFEYASKFGTGPGFFPFWLGIVLAAFSLFRFVISFKEKYSAEEMKPRLPGLRSLGRLGLIMVIMAGFALVMNGLGFILTVFLFVSVILFALEGDSILKSVFYGVMFSAGVFLIFRYWLEVDLPTGLLGI
jgi:putative tricarboxylic transport membrane protein